MSLWFTSDTHFGHANIIKHSERPFTNVDEMDEALIAAWNECVGPKDEVWHLGDFCHWRLKPGKYASRLNGRIHLVLGNHDADAKEMAPHFSTVQEVKYLRHEGERFWLSHYPHRAWRNSHHGCIHLFGHTHGDYANWRRSMDVGVDAVGYKPISFAEVVERLKYEEPTPHHDDGPTTRSLTDSK